MVDDLEVRIDFDFTGVPDYDLKKCTTLFETIAEIIGHSTKATLSLKSSFYALGGNSLNSIFAVSKLRSQGYFIHISYFISAKNLDEILSRIIDTANSARIKREPRNCDRKPFVEPLAHEHKDDAIEYAIHFHFLRSQLINGNFIQVNCYKFSG